MQGTRHQRGLVAQKSHQAQFSVETGTDAEKAKELLAGDGLLISSHGVSSTYCLMGGCVRARTRTGVRVSVYESTCTQTDPVPGLPGVDALSGH